jgi:L-threonylcarbamoyladenylate synthase
VAQALLQAFKTGKGGVAAPSANKFGHVSPTTAQHVRDEFGVGPDPDSPLACVLDGGQSAVGIESTIVDLSRMATHGPVLLRPGHVSAADIARVIGALPGSPDSAAPRASGTLDAHYAPRTPVALVDAEQLPATLQRLAAAGRCVALLSYAAPPCEPSAGQCNLPATPDGYAHGLYAALRALDARQADIILVEQPPTDGQWQAVGDRLRRAAFDSSGVLERLA